MSNKLYEKPLQLLRQFCQVDAVGASGSVSRDICDGLSDIDLCVFAEEQLPLLKDRERRYREFGISDFKYLDGNLEASRIDGFKIDGVDYDLLWMSLPETEKRLDDLNIDFDCDEYLPGGLLTVQTLFDPQGHIIRLCERIPQYSDKRARHRVKDNIDKAYFSIYDLGWAQKAPQRNDVFSYFFNKWTVFDYFISALFALNRQWRSHEKRIIEQIRHFDLAPSGVGDRVESIIMYRGENANLETNAKQLKQLFADLVTIASKEFATIDLPERWK